LKLGESAWFIAYDLTGKEQGELRILVRDSIPFPFLTRDEQGYVICLPNLKKVQDDVVEYHGMFLNLKDELHNEIMWSLFKSSVYYLSLYTIASNVNVYADCLKGKDEDAAINAINLVEDAMLTAYVKAFRRLLLPEIMLSDAVSYLLLKPAQLIRNEAVRLAASILSYYKTGMVKGTLPQGMLKETKDLVYMLRELESDTVKAYAEQKKQSDSEKIVIKPVNDDMKITVFSEIYTSLLKHSTVIPEVPSFFYMNHPTKTSIFASNLSVPTQDELKTVLDEVTHRSEEKVDLNMNALQSESVQNIIDWVNKEKKAEKILEKYKLLSEDTRFKDFRFPDEDYAEFLRRRINHSKTIRRITNRLAMYYNITGDDFRRDAGFIDLQEAIQVVASKSRRSDIFMEDTLRYRAQTWAILVDVSLSLRQFAGEVKDVVLCLTEVSRKLFSDNRSLGIFAFGDKFLIVKDFTENHGRTISARIGGIEHSGMTYLPDAIKLTAQVLRRQFEEEKFLIVVSDGHPTGYKSVVEDTKEQVAAAMRKGLNLIGIGIDSKGIKDFFPTTCIVRTPYELMKKFSDTFFQYTSMM
jgi:hypothetical protein